MLSNLKHPTYRSSDNYVHTRVQKFPRRRSAFHLKILVGRGLGKFLGGGGELHAKGITRENWKF